MPLGIIPCFMGLMISSFLVGTFVAGNVFLAQDVDVRQRLESKQETRIRVREEVAERRSDAKDRLQEVRDQRLEIKEEMRQKADEARARAEEMRDELRVKVQEIRDERKRQTVLRIAERLNTANARWVDHWGNVLDRMEDILAKLEARDTDGLVADELSAARAAIAEARDALDVQSGVVYEVEFDSETTLGEDVRGVIAEFRADLKATQESVRTARGAVALALSSFKGEN